MVTEISKINILNVNISDVTLSRADVKVLSVLELLRHEKQWPRKRERMKQFLEVKDLDILRQYNSRGVCHEAVILKDESKESRKKCVLCCIDNIGRNTRYYCSICLVPLCTTVFRGVDGEGTNTCFKRWHTCSDLRRMNERCHELLISGRNFDKRDSNKVFEAIHHDTSTVMHKSVKNEDGSGASRRRKIEIIQPLSIGTEIKRNRRKEGKQDRDKDKMEVKEYKDDEIIKKMHASLAEKVNKYWRVQTRRSCGGLPDVIW